LARATGSRMLRLVTHRHIEDEHIELAIGAVARIRDARQLSGRHRTGWLVGKRISGFAGTGEPVRQRNAAPRHGGKRPPTNLANSIPALNAASLPGSDQLRRCQPYAIAATIRRLKKVFAYI